MSRNNDKKLINRLNKRVRIEYPLAQPDGLGGKITSWQILTECFAEVVDDGSFQSQTGAQKAAIRGRFRVTIYPNMAITHLMRVVWQGKILQIHHSELYVTHMVLICEEEVGI
jgi:SPP1 family predicted phage head-tail adaptor